MYAHRQIPAHAVRTCEKKDVPTTSGMCMCVYIHREKILHLCIYILTSFWQVLRAGSGANFPAAHDKHEEAALVEYSPGLHCDSLGM